MAWPRASGGHFSPYWFVSTPPSFLFFSSFSLFLAHLSCPLAHLLRSRLLLPSPLTALNDLFRTFLNLRQLVQPVPCSTFPLGTLPLLYLFR